MPIYPQSAVNRTATVDPTASDDYDAGYPVGSEWCNTTTGVLWKSIDHATGSALWTPLPLKNNISATTDPTATDDSAAGYAVSSRWINTATNKEFVCTDATATAAVWTETTQTPAGSVFGTQYNYAESLTLSSTSSQTFQQKLRMTTPSLPNGTYHVTLNFEAGSDSGNKDVDVRVQLDDATDLLGPLSIPTQGDGSYTDHGFSGELSLNGVHNIDIDYRCGAASMAARIRNARITLWRVN